MATDTLVEKQIEDGQKLVEALLQGGFDMTAALWFKDSENGKWYFTIVSPLVDAEGTTTAYGRLHPLARTMPQPLSIDWLEIRLIGPSHPIAKAVIAALGRMPGPRVGPIPYRGNWLGNVSIDGAYFYPVPAATP
jgi:hypothetical protein